MKSIVIRKLPLSTVNRGIKPYIISSDRPGRYFAHEVGDLTPIARVIGGASRNAHRVNDTKRWGNQYNRKRITRPYSTIEAAVSACIQHARTHITR